MIFLISQGKVATYDRRGGEICKMFVSIFSGFNIPKIIKIGHFLTVTQKNKKVDVLGVGWDTECIIFERIEAA